MTGAGEVTGHNREAEPRGDVRVVLGWPLFVVGTGHPRCIPERELSVPGNLAR